MAAVRLVCSRVHLIIDTSLNSFANKKGICQTGCYQYMALSWVCRCNVAVFYFSISDGLMLAPVTLHFVSPVLTLSSTKWAIPVN